MILIADSGSTKTAWRLIDDTKNIHQFQTEGFNPYFQNAENIVKIIQQELIPQIKTKNVNQKLEIYYYGAGCSNPEKCEVVETAIRENFETSKIEVHHDLLAAARAVCGHEQGIAAILGTGSNSCYYDGGKIVKNIPALGYILGDEGSGAHMGKTFIKAYLNEELPRELSERFYQRTKLTKDDILEAVYKKPFPNRWLASFSKFIFQNIKDPYLVDLTAGCFEQFFDKHICKYENYGELKLNVVGSVGFYFSNILRSVARDKGVEIDRILESPIAGLTLYHLGE